jgi:UDP-N-acetyl-D-galactosamine dehydrogenase
MKSYKIAVIGLGYVGLPLAINFAKYYDVVGFDKNKLRIRQLRNNIDINNDITKKNFLNSKKIIFDFDEKKIRNCNIFIITVPTPVDKKNKPDLSMINSATKLVSSCLKLNDTVIFESTVFPGYTEEIAVPILEKFSGLSYLKDFNCGYSPERINPGDKVHKLQNIKKIISASDLSSLRLLKSLYSKIIKVGLFTAESIKIAEAAKIIENAQRDINIAFINEITFVFDKLGINTQKVLAAASSKWNFLNFSPGFVGGHCVAVDPYYLDFISKKNGYNTNFLMSARKINNSFHSFIANKIINILKKKINPSILVLGLTFKENCNDIRNSKIFEMLNILQKKSLRVSVFDPYVDRSLIRKKLKKIKFLTKLSRKNKYDLIVFCVKHDLFKKNHLYYEKMLKDNSFIFDVKNIFKNINSKKIITL